ncbi:hypothetical protein ACS0TY_032611 [Phlomoides rotata]
MTNTITDLSIISTFGITGKGPLMKCVRWQRPPLRFIQVNVNGGATGALDILTGGGVFRDNFGVFRGCFAMSHGTGFAFEAELAITLYALELTHEK